MQEVIRNLDGYRLKSVLSDENLERVSEEVVFHCRSIPRYLRCHVPIAGFLHSSFESAIGLGAPLEGSLHIVAIIYDGQDKKTCNQYNQLTPSGF